MFEHHLLEQIDRRLKRVEFLLGRVALLLLGEILCHRSPPVAAQLAATFTLSGDFSMNAVLIATIPSTRQDGSALAPTDIASITFQKTSLTGAPPVAGPQVTLIVNAAAAGVGLTPDQITFTDPSSVAGDSYTCFVTDTAGDTGALSNAVVAVAPVLSAPSAPVLSATFA